MPQMAPISWLILFFMFLLSFILFNIMNYYSYLPSTPSHQNKKKISPSMNWKW